MKLHAKGNLQQPRTDQRQIRSRSTEVRHEEARSERENGIQKPSSVKDVAQYLRSEARGWAIVEPSGSNCAHDVG